MSNVGTNFGGRLARDLVRRTLGFRHLILRRERNTKGYNTHPHSVRKDVLKWKNFINSKNKQISNSTKCIKITPNFRMNNILIEQKEKFFSITKVKKTSKIDSGTRIVRWRIALF
jgi:hypothetical protein